jgi:nitrogen regulatory protein PII-like uncharacterized protein
MEMAQELAGLRIGGDSLWAYDNEGLGAIDVTAFRLREDPSLSIKDIANLFAQANNVKPLGADSHVATLKNRVDNRLETDEEYISLEVELKVSPYAMLTCPPINSCGFSVSFATALSPC